MLRKNLLGLCGCMAVYLVLSLSSIAAAQQKSAPANSDVTGRYEGSAKNGEGEVIEVTLELTEKEGAVTGVIHSSHGDFTITGGSHKEDAVTLEFATDGPTGNISLKVAKDTMVGTWSAGDDGGEINVKRAADKS